MAACRLELRLASRRLLDKRSTSWKRLDIKINQCKSFNLKRVVDHDNSQDLRGKQSEIMGILIELALNLRANGTSYNVVAVSAQTDSFILDDHIRLGVLDRS